MMLEIHNRYGKRKDGGRMSKKIKIRKVSAWSFAITIIVTVLFAAIAAMGRREFGELKSSTELYIVCENAAKQLQDGSDYLSEQVRLYAMTGQTKYMDLYFQEANETKRRENAIAQLKEYFDGTEVMDAIEEAQEHSLALMETEYYSMRLMEEASLSDPDTWPVEIQNTSLTDTDEAMSASRKIKKAQQIVCDDEYQKVRNEVNEGVTKCMDALLKETRNSQGRATTIFSDMYRKLEIGVGILAALMLIMCFIVRRLIVKPLISYNESIRKGEIFPVIGAEELQNLAETYNKVFKENEEAQKLIRHEAEHDSLTDLLNRGSFDRILNMYETGDRPFAMIIVDVDTFKSVNDTYGHAVGDAILKRVAGLLKTAFRSIDYVCRIGGDEFAIVMVEMTSDLKYTIEDKIKFVNQELSRESEGIPAVSLSVGVAFSDRENPGKSIYTDADKALYHIKENGRNGCGFY